MAMTTDEIKEKCDELECFMRHCGLKDARATFSWCSTKRWNVFQYDADKVSNHHSYSDDPARAFMLAMSFVAHVTDHAPVALDVTQDYYGDMNDRADKMAAKWGNEQ